MKRILMMVAMSLLVASACGDSSTGSHIGNPVSIGFTVRSALSGAGQAPTMQDETGTVYALKVARANVRDVRLRLPVGMTCADVDASDMTGATCDLGDDVPAEPEIRVEGPFVVDLLTGLSPGLASVRVPDLAYTRVDYRLDDADPDDGVVAATDPLSELSMIVDADFESASGPAQLRLRLKFNEDLRVEFPGGIAVGAGERILIGFDAAGWLSEAGIGECLSSGELQVVDGAVVVDEDSGCDGVEEAVKENIKEGLDLVDDSSDDTTDDSNTTNNSTEDSPSDGLEDSSN